jgi:hypothetical protein
MTAAAAGNPVTGPVDSLEVRWIVPGLLTTAMREWFARFPAGTERREDTYLLQPQLRGLSVKLRGRGALDVKAHLGNPVTPDLPVRGRLESWRKWSFPYDPQGPAGGTPVGWITVRKQRHSSWFPLTTRQDPVPAPQEAARPGCAVELTEFRVRSDPWWTVGFEATGPVDLRPDALRHTADRVFAQPLPAGVELSLDNSQSYTQWLHERPGPGTGDTMRPTLSPPGDEQIAPPRASQAPMPWRPCRRSSSRPR